MAVVASATGAAVFGLSGVAAGLAGGALLGAGAGALYSGITGDGNILNSALTGGLLGAGVGGLGAALAPAAGGSAVGGGAAGMKVGTAGTSSVGLSPALKTVAGSSASTATGLTAPTLSSLSPLGTLGGTGTTTAALTGGQKLAAGLAGTTALSMLGSKNQPKLQDQDSESYIRPYTYSQKRNPNYGQPGESYFTQSYEAGEPYKAASGGIMRMADGGNATGDNFYALPIERPPEPGIPMMAPPQAQPNSGMLSLAAPSSQYGPAVGSPEAKVAGLYRNVLGRAPDAAGGKYWEDALRSGSAIGDIRNEFIASPENQAREAQRGSVNSYNRILEDRASNEYNVQPAPLSTLPGGGQFASAPDVSKIINRYYQQNLGRNADQEGLAHQTRAVTDSGVGLGQIAQNIRTSPEGMARQQAQDAAKKQQAQAALEANPAYQAHMSAPINESNFDRNAYLSTHKDVAQAGVDPYEHYLKHGIGEGRAVSKLPFQQKSNQSNQSGYKYNPVTKSFTAPSGVALAQESGGLPDFTSDPGFQSYLQTQYNNYQQSQGGAAGGLMPGSLRYAMGGNVQGYNLGGYSDGGRLLRGPGDGVSDDIPATIGNRQPARLADGEFVIPARIVSELGNGSTDAGAKRLYAMMDRIQAGRKKTVGKGNVAKDSKAKKHLLA